MKLIQVITKMRKVKTILAILTLVLLSQNTFAQEAISVAEKSNVASDQVSGFYYNWFIGLLVLSVFVILLLTITLLKLSKLLTQGNEKVEEKASSLPKWWHDLDKKVFTRAVAIEQEEDILLDHDYDGIKELDNALPPWWKYGFYFTIIVAFIYIYNFHGGGNGKNPREEYEAELEQAKADKELYESKNKDKIDEANVPMADAAGIEKGKEIFQTACFACHGKLGEGGAGPNLTDDYWIHKGSLNDVYMSIKNGYPDKGMQAWSIKYNPKEISLLASYIKTLKGTNPPNGKAPQGDLYNEGGSTTAPSDSTKTDSLQKPTDVNNKVK